MIAKLEKGDRVRILEGGCDTHAGEQGEVSEIYWYDLESQEPHSFDQILLRLDKGARCTVSRFALTWAYYFCEYEDCDQGPKDGLWTTPDGSLFCRDHAIATLDLQEVVGKDRDLETEIMRLTDELRALVFARRRQRV